MIPGALAFLAVAAAAILLLPRRLAVVPLLLTAAYTGRANVIELGPANLSALRILVLIGFIRALARGERLAGGVHVLDALVGIWAVMLVGLSAFHTSDAWTVRIGMTLGELGFYFLCRLFITSAADVLTVFQILCIALLPLAILMSLEKYTGQNLFGAMGGNGFTAVRDGHARASGPFAHPILAGTVGAACLPMALALWRHRRLTSIIGVATSVAITIASTASGPVMMAIFAAGGMAMWPFRHGMRAIRWVALAAVVALDLAMTDPVYFLMARIDITGSSTGWHRAQLVRSSIEHLDEWWLAGTDYTRHWMASGIYANYNHTDITNHILGIGVLGGLPLVAVFLLILVCAFRLAGQNARAVAAPPSTAFLSWSLGALLFGHTMNFWSISLFDQSISFFYLTLAMMPAVGLTIRARTTPLTRRESRRRAERQFERAAALTHGAVPGRPAMDRPFQLSASTRFYGH